MGVFFFEHPLKVLFIGTRQLFYASSKSGGWSMSGWISALVTGSSTWDGGGAGACRLALGGVSFSTSFLEGDWARLLLEDCTPCWLNWTSLFLLKIGDCGRLKLLMMPVNLLGSNSEFKVWLLGGSSPLISRRANSALMSFSLVVTSSMPLRSSSVLCVTWLVSLRSSFLLLYLMARDGFRHEMQHLSREPVKERTWAKNPRYQIATSTIMKEKRVKIVIPIGLTRKKLPMVTRKK